MFLRSPGVKKIEICLKSTFPVSFDNNDLSTVFKLRTLKTTALD